MPGNSWKLQNRLPAVIAFDYNVIWRRLYLRFALTTLADASSRQGTLIEDSDLVPSDHREI
jgi:hypothetical protein